MSKNLEAFLGTLAFSELGSDVLQHSDNGYNVLAGSLPGMVLTFSSYSRHPGTTLVLGSNLKTTAAGRYQILYKIWKAYCPILGLTDFSKAAQDAIATRLISECHAMDDIEAGRIEAAIIKCRSRWASLPGSRYDQPHHSMTELLEYFQKVNG